MKMFINLRSLLAVAFVASSSVSPLTAAEAKKEKTTDSKTKTTAVANSKAAGTTSEKKTTSKATTNRKVPFYGKVVASTQRSVTIKSSEDGPERRIGLNAQTKITKDKEPMTSKDIVIGKWVGGSVEKAEDGSETAVTLNLSAKQREEKPVAKSAGTAAKAESTSEKTKAK